MSAKMSFALTSASSEVTHTPEDRHIFMGLSPGCRLWRTAEGCHRWQISLESDTQDMALLLRARFERGKLNHYGLSRSNFIHGILEVALPCIDTEGVTEIWRYRITTT